MSTNADFVDSPASNPPAPPRTLARTVEASARSELGTTSPWLLLPPERNYQLYVPAHTETAHGLALVVMIHGCKENAREFAQGTRMNAIADREGFAVLYPDQASFANLRRCWNWFEPNTAAGLGECAIILEMIRAARAHAPIDSRRVCVAGMSSGAALAGLLAFHHPEVFAAAALHSGLPPMQPPSAAGALNAMEHGVRVDAATLADTYWRKQTGERKAALPPALFVLHGDADTRVSEKNATAMTRLWERLFESAPAARPLEREDKAVPRTDRARGYAQMDWLSHGRIVIRSVRIHGLAHAWSGGDPALPYNDAQGPDATAMIWRFFERQLRVTAAKHPSEYDASPG